MKVCVKVYVTETTTKTVPRNIAGLCLKLAPNDEVSFDLDEYKKHHPGEVIGWGMEIVSALGEIHGPEDVIQEIRELQRYSNGEQLKLKKNIWIVKLFGVPGQDPEISAVRINAHGAHSYGYEGIDKIIILRGKDCNTKVTEEMIKEAQGTAQVICDYKNKSL